MMRRLPLLPAWINRSWGTRGKAIRNVPVDVVTLDELVARRSTTEQIALWEDVEGNAAEVLEGAKALLRARWVTTELVGVESVGVWNGGDDVGAFSELLQGGGLRSVVRDHQFSAKPVYKGLFIYRSVAIPVTALPRRDESF